MLGGRFKGKKSDHPDDRRSAELLASLSVAGEKGSDELQLALRNYLGFRLGLHPASLTYVDVAPELRRRGASEETLAKLERVFNSFEASRYAGGAGADLTAAEAGRLASEACGSLEELF